MLLSFAGPGRAGRGRAGAGDEPAAPWAEPGKALLRGNQLGPVSRQVTGVLPGWPVGFCLIDSVC